MRGTEWIKKESVNHNQFCLLLSHCAKNVCCYQNLFSFVVVVVFEQCLFLFAVDVAVLLAAAFADLVAFAGHVGDHLFDSNCTGDLELVEFVGKMDDFLLDYKFVHIHALIDAQLLPNWKIDQLIHKIRTVVKCV